MVDSTGLLAMSPFFCGPPLRAGFQVHKLFGRPGFWHFTYTHFSGGLRGFRILPAQFFRVAVTVAFAFYLHKLFGGRGLHFTYTHFSVAGVRILPTHTFGAFLKQHCETLFQI